jgi:TniQ
MQPERTMFHPLPLIGVGTNAVEGLGSYLRRLAFSHQLKPVVLLELLFERMPLEDLRTTAAHLHHTWNVAGPGEVGGQIVERLVAQTGRDVSAGSLRRFADLFSAQSFGRRVLEERYCPLCVRETYGNDLPFGRLLWEVRCIAACPRHGVRLRNSATCGAPEVEHLPVGRRPLLNGVCKACGSIGFRCVTTELEVASPSEMWVAEQVGAMVALPSLTVELLSPETLHEGLKTLVDVKFNGLVVPPSIKAGMARATLSTWLNGTFKPSLPGLLQLCMLANCDLVPLLQGRVEESTGRQHEGIVPRVVPRTYHRVTLSDDEIRQSLRQAAVAPVPPSLKSHCEALGVRGDRSGKKFPEEVAQLKTARNDYMRAQSARLRAEMEAKLEAAAAQLKAQGLPIKCRTLEEVAGVVAWTRHPAMKAVLARHGVAQ